MQVGPEQLLAHSVRQRTGLEVPFLEAAAGRTDPRPARPEGNLQRPTVWPRHAQEEHEVVPAHQPGYIHDLGILDLHSKLSQHVGELPGGQAPGLQVLSSSSGS